MELHLFNLGGVDAPPLQGMDAYMGTYSSWAPIEQYVAQKIEAEGGWASAVVVQVAIFDGEKLVVAAEHTQGKWNIILPEHLGLRKEEGSD